MTGNWLIPAVIALVILGIAGSAWLVRARVQIPGTFRIKKLSPEDIDSSSATIIGRYDQDLAQLGFEKVGDFEVADLAGENLHRGFIHPADATEAMVSVVMSGLRRIPNLEFFTKFDDQNSLSTDQGAVPNYFEIPPERMMQRFPGLKPTRLYQIHRKRLSELMAKGARPIALSRDSIFKFIEQDQQDLLNHQVKKGFMTADSENDLLKPTWKFSFYFIIRNLDPFPFGISAARFISALLICAGIMYGLFALARWGKINELAPGISLSEAQIDYALSSLAAVLSSLLIGWMIRRRGFLWAGLISVLGILVFIYNLFPNAWILILISAQAGQAGNRIYESRLTQSPSRLPSQLLVLLVLIVIGWMMLTAK